MDNTVLIQLLMKDEMPSLSFFTDISLGVVRTAVAMANGNGGFIVVGVSDSKKIVGIANVEKKIEELNGLLKQATPLLPFSISVQKIENVDVLVVIILEGGKKPYLVDGAFFVLHGESAVKASNEEIAELFLQRERQDSSWERGAVPEVEDSDISQKAYNRVLDNMVSSGRINSETSFEELLYKLGMRVDDHITNAGVVMFAEKPSLFIPQSRIRLSIYADDESLIEVRMYDSDLVSNIEDIVNFISTVYGDKIIIEGLERKEKKVVPLVALREGLFNACVHREYETVESFVIINLFSDRLEIKNSGRLPDGLSFDALLHSHISIIRNPDIANACQQAGYIEMVGSGIQRIIDTCHKNGCATPIWTTDEHHVTLTFPNVFHNRTIACNSIEISLTNIASSGIVKEDLLKIVDYIRKERNCKTIDLQSLIGKSSATIRRYLLILRSAGIIQYEGSRKTGGWVYSAR